MSTYKLFKPLSAEADLNNVLEVNKDRQSTRIQKKLKLLEDLKPIKCLSSFLVRALHDYVTGERNSSLYERQVMAAWERAGLNKGSAARALQNLYSLGPQLFQKLDAHYLSGAPDRLDARLVADVSRINWNEYFNSTRVLSADRLSKALKSGSMIGLKPREKAFVSGLTRTYKKRSWRQFTSDEKTKSIADRIIRPIKSKYYLTTPRMEVYKFKAKRDLSDWIASIIDQPEPQEPEMEMTCYDWYIDRLGHRIVQYDEATGDDPVFIYTLFRHSETASPAQLVGPVVYKPPDNEKHNNFRSSVSRIYPSSGAEFFWAYERPLLIVSAFEDDQWFSDDTQAYVDFGTDIASMVASLDPTGYASIIVTIWDITWDVLLFLDWLDDNDYVGTAVYEFNIDLIPETVGRDNPFVHQVDLRMSGSGSTWDFRIRMTVKGAMFVPEEWTD